MALIIELSRPITQATYRTKDRTKLRFADMQSSGQVELIFRNDEEAKSFLAALLGELEAPLPTI